ncbi:MAG: universal stress protein [Flavipsychrobacter sp.]
MKRILIPVDFTPASRNASEYAAALARVFNAAVYLLYVYMEPTPAVEVSGVWMMAGAELQEANEALVSKEVNFLKAKYAVAISGAAKVGPAAAIITDTANELQADLIVMGMKGGSRSKWLGGTVIATIRQSQTPVLVIHEEAVFAPIKQVVVAADFNEISDVSCWSVLFTLLEQFDATLRVVHVQGKGAEMAVAELPGALQVRRYLSRYPYQYEEIEDRDVEQGLLSYIGSHPADLLVMVAHHHTIFERLFGTVHTRNISFDIKLPLLILKDTP